SVGWKPVESSRWWAAGQWITQHHALATAVCLIVMAVVGYGMTQVESSVQLMRLFSRKAQIRTDYAWLESHLGPLVPMEILVRIDEKCPLNFLERMELVDEIQREIGSLDAVGSSLSTVTFGRNLEGGSAGEGLRAKLARSTLNKALVRHRDDFLAGDYLREAKVADSAGFPRQQELWRISARVSAIQEVDYALFKADLQKKIDPVLTRLDGDGVSGIVVDYTGLVPLVYKAQHSLLENLKIGFIFDFAIIVVVMILLCRATSAGLVLLLPAAFPAVVVFGFMGWGNALLKSMHAGNLFIDIGSVMAPSVALGVTVDDVVHFMLWFRRGIADGLDRKQATMLAYKGCARAMYQSWGVIGIGLSVFSLSPFGPTQRFGHMMLAMLTVALVGNLVLMPAMLSGPLGGLFAWSVHRIERKKAAQAGRRYVIPNSGSDALPAPHVAPGPAKQVVHA
ncbi:MAG: MMPL family transporter, partial [Planctomycetota bacterium]